MPALTPFLLSFFFLPAWADVNGVLEEMAERGGEAYVLASCPTPAFPLDGHGRYHEPHYIQVSHQYDSPFTIACYIDHCLPTDKLVLLESRYRR
jgi:hypothetical protein